MKREVRKKKWKFLPYWDVSDEVMADVLPPK
jgi:hypothetical protein